MKSLISISVMLLWTTVSFGQFQNGGFETWTRGNPDGWMTPNVPGFLTLVEEVTHTHYEGHSSARLFTNEMVPGSFVIQTLTEVRVEESVAISFYFSGLTAGGVGMLGAVGYVDGQPVDGTEGLFEPFGNAWMQSFNQWRPQVRQFDSLVVTIAISDTADQPTEKSVLIDEVATMGLTSLSVKAPVSLPVTYSLINVYPNPFNGNASIRYSAPISGAVISLIDPSGRLVSKASHAGSGSLNWKDLTAGRELPAGRYSILLSGSQGAVVAPAILLK